MEGMNPGTCSSCHSCSFCGCMHHKIAPAAILLIALAFLLQAMGVVSEGFVNVAWPVLLGLAALVKLGAGKCKCYGSK